MKPSVRNASEQANVENDFRAECTSLRIEANDDNEHWTLSSSSSFRFLFDFGNDLAILVLLENTLPGTNVKSSPLRNEKNVVQK